MFFFGKAKEAVNATAAAASSVKSAKVAAAAAAATAAATAATSSTTNAKAAAAASSVASVASAKATTIAALYFSACSILFSIVAHVIPLHYTVLAINSSDRERLKKILLYWSILHMFLALDTPVIMYFVCRSTQMPITIKLIVAIVLNVGDFSVPQLISDHVLAPFLKKYEKEINGTISFIQKSIISIVLSRFQHVMWQLFLSPNNGIIPYQTVLDMVFGKPEKESEQTSMHTKHSNNHNNNNNNTNTQKNDKLQLGQKILIEARRILLEGLVVQLSLANNDDENLTFYSVLKLNTFNELYLKLKLFQISDKTKVEAKVQIALFNIKSVSLAGFDDSSTLLIELFSPIKLPDNLSMPLQKSLLITLSSVEDCDGFIAGMQAISFASKKKIAQAKTNLSKICQKTVRKAFQKLSMKSQSDATESQTNEL